MKLDYIDKDNIAIIVDGELKQIITSEMIIKILILVGEMTN